MNFYRAQDQARKQTFWLVGLFVVSVSALVLLTLVIVATFVWYSDPGLVAGEGSPPQQANLLQAMMWGMERLGWARMSAITALVSGVIGMGVVFRWWNLRDGGHVVAEAMGGKPLTPQDEDFKAQRLRNIVEEMALAAGMPVPPVYVLPNERGINAFAAGLSQEDAVVAVSQGCLESLNREQLQGVVAHELSHILNGDMRLNVQMVAVLHGITMISEAGRVLMDVGRHTRGSSDREKGSVIAALFMMGLALFILGWIGQLFGHMIRAAVSRQREYLADASAVQFTRNPEGISGALRVIAGHALHGRLNHRAAHEYSHLFFANALRGSWFASHPPLDDRIKRILPRWDGSPLQPQAISAEESARMNAQSNARDAAMVAALAPIEFERVAVPKAKASASAASSRDTTTRMPLAGLAMVDVNDGVQCVTEFEFDVSRELGELVHDPLGAVSVILALLLDDDKTVADKQRMVLLTHVPTWQAPVERARKVCAHLSPMAHLGVLELAMPAFKRISQKQYMRLRQVMTQVIQADLKVSPNEWAIYEWVRQHGDRHFGLSRPFKPKYRKLQQVQQRFNVVLCRILACQEDEEPQQKSLRHMQACEVAGIEEMPMVGEERARQASFTRAVHDLRLCYPLLKPRMLKALIFAARADGKVSADEQQLITTIALIWDCPLIGLDDAFA
ncbi:MAG: M48 family metallopeptidase [Oleiphilaceae bacterium]|nr:M48 family metallopeptidase [Oleiphilaceae bacterium]